MVFKHGITTSERSTSVKSAAQVGAGLTVVVGTAPVNLVSDPSLHKPVLAMSFGEAAEKLGYSNNLSDFTLCEVMDTHFKLFNVGPVVFINVMDPTKHKTTVTDSEIPLSNGKATIQKEGILLDSLVVKSAPGASTPLIKNTDYTAAFDSNGLVVISAVSGGAITTGALTKVVVTYSHLDSSKVTNNDIIGGYDALTGKSTGIELINSVFPLLRLVPGVLIAPKFSKSTAVAAVMRAKVKNINGNFKAITIVDIDTTVAPVYTDAVTVKNANSLVDSYQDVRWGDLKLGDKEYHFSSQQAALIAYVDSTTGDIPFKSPSNKGLQMDALLANGLEVALGPDQAEFLNANGINTALNFIGGWKSWGNRTSAYPGTTDVKDSFIAVRRMFNWIGNTLILSFWDNVDDPTNARLIDTFLDSSNIWLNGLSAQGALLGGRVEFREEENPLTDLLNGKVRLHVFAASPVPAEHIEFIVEFDVEYLNTLFAA